MGFRNFIFSVVKPMALGAFILAVTPLYAESERSIGVYLNRGKTLLYAAADRQGRVYHTTRKTPFRVVDVRIIGKAMMLKIEFPFRTRKKRFVGYVIYPDRKIKPARDSSPDGILNVFSVIPTENTQFPNYVSVPIRGITYSKVSGESQLYENIKWYEVSYELTAPITFWVNSAQGIYREFGSPEVAGTLLNSINQFTPAVAENLILGNIQPGYSEKHVLRAMGEPDSKIDIKNGSVIWYYPLFYLEFAKNKKVNKVNYYSPG